MFSQALRSDRGQTLRTHWRAAVLGGYVAALAAFALLHAGGNRLHEGVMNVGQFLGPLVAILWFWPGFKQRPKADRAKGLCVAGLLLGPLAFSVGQVVWSYYEVVLGVDAPFPSWPDFGFFTAYLFLFVGVLKLPARPIGSLARWRILLDSFSSMAALVTFSWYFILAPQLAKGNQTTLGKALGMFYPLADLALIFCLLMMAGGRAQAGMRWGIVTLSAGLLSIITVDTYFAVATLHENYVTGGVIDLLWPLGYMLIALSAYLIHRSDVSQLKPVEAAEPHGPALWQSLLPYAFMPPAIALLCFVYGVGGWDVRSWGVYGGAAVLMMLVLARQFFVVCENERLYRRLEDLHGQLETSHRDLKAANSQLRILAATDALTGLPNRHALQQRLREETARARRMKRPLGLIILDVDFFKKLNDTHGHPAGDEVLRTISSLLRSCLRESDLPARFGGEEFVVLVPESAMQETARVAERVRAVIAEHRFEQGRVTVSLGVASSVETDADMLLRDADAALYRSKLEGRNRVTCAGESLAETQSH